MNKQQTLLAAVLWAAAILAAALLGTPAFFSQILLPLLAATSLLPRTGSCLTRSSTP
ncbi:hypothetical protein ISP17_17885 [Dyella ginsengisoli]|uniref:Uncharacterized protein n=1 Tax=Dyella ginsengisoli TaxID=363848 RepID=A0ABW8JXF2_9GAMM